MHGGTELRSKMLLRFHRWPPQRGSLQGPLRVQGWFRGLFRVPPGCRRWRWWTSGTLASAVAMEKAEARRSQHAKFSFACEAPTCCCVSIPAVARDDGSKASFSGSS